RGGGARCMNPMDFLYLFVSIGLAALVIGVRGWTLNGIGPAALAVMAGLWHFSMQWLRHQSWLRHRDSGFSPPTQHLLMSAVVGLFMGTLAAIIWLLATVPDR